MNLGMFGCAAVVGGGRVCSALGVIVAEDLHCLGVLGTFGLLSVVLIRGV